VSPSTAAERKDLFHSGWRLAKEEEKKKKKANAFT